MGISWTIDSYSEIKRKTREHLKVAKIFLGTAWSIYAAIHPFDESATLRCSQRLWLWDMILLSELFSMRSVRVTSGVITPQSLRFRLVKQQAQRRSLGGASQSCKNIFGNRLKHICCHPSFWWICNFEMLPSLGRHQWTLGHVDNSRNNLFATDN
jgi:hypothetical protein